MDGFLATQHLCPAAIKRFFRRENRRFADLDASHDAYFSLRRRHSTVWVGALQNRTKQRKIDLHRRQRFHVSLSDVEIGETRPDPLDQLIRAEVIDELRLAVDRLPVATRDAIIRHCMYDEPVRQIAEDWGCSEQTIYSRLRRGRHALRQAPNLRRMQP